ncbi:predicted protein [Botrytis cinerea T4]|uniref:Uncharacterized protein n=1 Tax=Botryotinia fuckeliana (strain T4) TaxID=999810 RepID=G2YMP8_BOTF4|nr:predicted protein [Botrytis cinerea T4]
MAARSTCAASVALRLGQPPNLVTRGTHLLREGHSLEVWGRNKCSHISAAVDAQALKERERQATRSNGVYNGVHTSSALYNFHGC